MVWVVSKCSIYHVQSPISLIFKGLQTPHFSTIFEKILGIVLFYANKIACHILVTICEPCRIPTESQLHFRWIDGPIRLLK